MTPLNKIPVALKISLCPNWVDCAFFARTSSVRTCTLKNFLWMPDLSAGYSISTGIFG